MTDTNLVEHRGAGYIVMEYVGGPSLKSILKDRQKAAGHADPFPLREALAYLIEILPAFSYLHERGLIFNDFKPDNVIQTEDHMRLIDLGAVTRLDDQDAAIYGTVGFQAPEIAETGPTVPADLYTVGRTLAVLSLDFKGYQTTFKYDLPPVEDTPLFQRYESFHRFLLRACHADPAARFQSAQEMLDQMVMVLREVLASEGHPAPAPSTLFAPEERPADFAETPDWTHLPAPLVDAADPAYAYLQTLTVTDPIRLLDLLDSAPVESPEVILRRVRARLDIAALQKASSGLAAEFRAAESALAAARSTLAGDWRLVWWDGVLSLGRAQAGEKDMAQKAVTSFEEVYAFLPGELAPKLALAMSNEVAADFARAEELYDVVSLADPTFTSASAGLARVRLAQGQRAGAVAACARVAVTAAAHHLSQVRALRSLLDVEDPERKALPPPTPAELGEAASLLTSMSGDASEMARLRALLLTTVLDALKSGKALPQEANALTPGRGVSEVDVRLELEKTYRDLARVAPRDEKIRLVDQANAVRPKTLT